jgi:hypothetical protein
MVKNQLKRKKECTKIGEYEQKVKEYKKEIEDLKRRTKKRSTFSFRSSSSFKLTRSLLISWSG